jgi:hypothetical protein
MPSIGKIFGVKAKPNYYQEASEFTKYFTDENAAYDYMDVLLNRIWYIQIMVIVEEGLYIIEDIDSKTVFMISCDSIENSLIIP